MKPVRRLLAWASVVLVSLCANAHYAMAYPQPRPCPCRMPCPPAGEAPCQSFTIYLWVPGQHGDAVVRGIPVDVDISISETLSALQNLDSGFVGHYEYTDRPWTLLVDLLSIKLSDAQQTPLNGTVEFSPSFTIAELGAAYDVDTEMDRKGFRRVTQVLGGVRYTAMALTITPALLPTISGRQEWLDPFVGVRYQQQLSTRWDLSARADIGGFGIGDASDFTWNTVLIFSAHLARQWDANLGWRVLHYNYENGAGASLFQYDATLSGPVIGFTYQY